MRSHEANRGISVMLPGTRAMAKGSRAVARFLTLPSSSSCRHEFNEPGFVAENLRTRLHTPPKDGCAISLAPSPESSGTVGSEGLINGSNPSTAFNPCAFFLHNQLSPCGILIRAPGPTHRPGLTRPTWFDPPDPVRPGLRFFGELFLIPASIFSVSTPILSFLLPFPITYYGEAGYLSAYSRYP
ncbi:hypothetical protein PIB30_071782 [Stylosanthes scabra]|uniref:Uncharacterized protein n=1 Tax=Stylosanthes scabra TaxID=79078 RepID=A0ABU6RQ39_9FABA|nr:hypothetical protein [Stylosanthes scabra]